MTGIASRLGLLAGPLIFAAMLIIGPPEGMTSAAWRTAAVGVLMATWWITEAIPVPATALLPLVLLPLLGVASIAETAAPYANPVIYLFLGGFLIAMALESCGLHRRMALAILAVVGTRPANLILGFMTGTAFISMWVSNTATVVMMLPMATSVIALAQGDSAATRGATSETFTVALLLGIAYAGNIGGLGTLIGTPPNALLTGFMAESYDIRIGFVEWMLLGVPIVVLSLPEWPAILRRPPTSPSLQWFLVRNSQGFQPRSRAHVRMSPAVRHDCMAAGPRKDRRAWLGVVDLSWEDSNGVDHRGRAAQ